jgi:type II secretory ATPase GspE/PulE/Tfp pilus assembly ATPase PilB-like protein
MTQTTPGIIHSTSLAQQIGCCFNAPAEEGDGERWAQLLLEDAVREGTSDIHFEPLENVTRVRFRIDGALHDVVTLPAGLGERIVRYFKANSGGDTAAGVIPVTSHLRSQVGGETIDVRVASVPCIGGERMTLRLLRHARSALRLSELGLGQDERECVLRWLDESNGTFLVAGPTGAGKTTTLYALLSEMKLMRHSVITIEDPVEYQMPGISQIQVDAIRGLTFAEGLRAALRLDPDYILLGEVRDDDSAEIALEAASTGHILLSTIHSRDAAGAVTMLRNFGLPSRDLAGSLSCIVAQRLVRTLCLHCRLEDAPNPAELRWLRAIGEPAPKTVWRAKGCEACGFDGYAGRTGIFEIWPVNEKSYELLLTGADEHSLRKHLRASGVTSLAANGLAKASAGEIDLDELRAAALRGFLRPQDGSA